MRIAHVHDYTPDMEKNAVKSGEVEVDIQPMEYTDDLGIFEDRKQYMKFLYATERVIRDSFEYTELMDFLKHRHGMNCCGIHQNLSSDWGIRIEEHHHPFQLSDICVVIINKRYLRGEPLKMQEIAREVMELHYLGAVGIYPLCTLCHSYYHSDHGDNFFIPMENVFGNPRLFVELYQPYFTESLRTKWDNLNTLEKGYGIIRNHLPLELQKKYIYLKPFDKDPTELIGTDRLIEFIHDLNKPDAKPKDGDGFFHLIRRTATS